jgi:hypothetical protein
MQHALTAVFLVIGWLSQFLKFGIKMLVAHFAQFVVKILKCVAIVVFLSASSHAKNYTSLVTVRH